MSFKAAEGEEYATELLVIEDGQPVSELAEPNVGRLGLGGRIRGMMGRAQEAFYGLVGNMHAGLDKSVATYKNPADSERRHKLTRGVLGAVAVAGAAGLSYLAMKGLTPHHAIDANTLMPHGGTGNTAHSLGNSFHANSLGVEVFPAQPTGASHVHQAVHEHARHLTTTHAGLHGGHQIVHEAHHNAVQTGKLSLSYNGDTIEGEISHHFHLSRYDPRLTKIAGQVLHQQGLSWDDARHLPVGYSFRLPPPHILEALIKTGS